MYGKKYIIFTVHWSHKLETKLTKEEVVELYAELIYSGEVTPKEVHTNNKLFMEQYIHKHMSEDDYIPKERITKEIGYTAYIHILEEGSSAREALLYAASVHGKDEDFIKTTKNLNHYPAREVFNQADSHEQQKLMRKNDTLRVKTLTSANTANRQLKELEVNKRVSDQLEKLKAIDEAQQEQIDTLKVNSDSLNIELDSMQQLLGIQGLSEKEMAAHLKSKHYTQKQIADHLGKALSTVKRWWKDL